MSLNDSFDFDGVLIIFLISLILLIVGFAFGYTWALHDIHSVIIEYCPVADK
ncbi:hypothetical protein [Shewanella algae]|uniref:hypothetical protein n=1 Tax=Shewanella algae TaxID=38313 RepID=UPI001AAD237A|nr:hypothetical protein [Shewanella algae]MBO2683537.1 hypothetical protein [Shewanella algae]QTE84346.1 hypothetical protein JKK46_11115 [Shewanella algae]QTE84355.1 hypothetical protein JKK46_11170 [Shewanella algae]